MPMTPMTHQAAGEVLAVVVVGRAFMAGVTIVNGENNGPKANPSSHKRR